MVRSLPNGTIEAGPEENPDIASMVCFTSQRDDSCRPRGKPRYRQHGVLHVPTGRFIPARGETPGIDIITSRALKGRIMLGKGRQFYPCRYRIGVPVDEASLQDAHSLGSVFPGVLPRAGMNRPVGTNPFPSIRNRMIPGSISKKWPPSREEGGREMKPVFGGN
jgi:hypothetical protein